MCYEYDMGKTADDWDHLRRELAKGNKEQPLRPRKTVKKKSLRVRKVAKKKATRKGK